MSEKLTFPQYLEKIPVERREAIKNLRAIFSGELPEGFEESVSTTGISYDVPHSLYPPGYHCKPENPLPFLTIISQKNFIALYHMGIYADNKLLEWFTREYPKHSPTKPDMGKSCIRFKNPEQIPYELLQELAGKLSVKDWIRTYEAVVKKT